MTDTSGRDWQVGSISNGHILTLAGWVPLRDVPTGHPAHYRPGDVVAGHAYTGSEWVPLAPNPTNGPMSQAAQTKSLWRRPVFWVAVVVGLAVLGSVSNAMDEPSDEAVSRSAAAPEATKSPGQANAKPEKKHESPKPKPTPLAPPAPPPPPADPNVINGLKVDPNITCGGDDFSSRVSGVITNVSSETMSYVSITFNLYDASGAVLGNAWANMNNLPPGTDWKYEAVGSGGTFAKCAVADVVAW